MKQILPSVPVFIKPALLAIIMSCFFAGDLMAQSGGFAGAYTRMGFGPRGMGMGNAMTAVHQHGVFAHYNPALASTVQGTQFDFSASSMSFDRSFNMANVAFMLPPNAGINIGLLHAGVSDFDGRTSSGIPTEQFSTNEFSAFIAFGLNPGERLSLGFSAKLFYVDYFDNVDSPLGFGIDIGLLYHASSQLTFGATVQDIFSSYSWNTSGLYGGSLANRTDSFPIRFKFGAAYEFQDYDLLISADIETRSQSSEIINRRVNTDTGRPGVITSREDIVTGSSQFRIGSSYSVHERIDVRAGFDVGDLTDISQSQRVSAGFSLWLPLSAFDSYIDYTFVREPEGISYMHVFALRVQL